MIVLHAGCGGDDDNTKSQDTSSHATGDDAGQKPEPSDAAAMDGSLSPSMRDVGTASTGGDQIDASASAGDPADAAARPNPDAPPETQDGKKLYAVRFDARAGEQPFACGKQVALGKAATLAEPLDIRFFVHDVTLVRANGERVPLALYQDERWQRDDVALLDFADDTGKCATGDKAVRTVVYGYADEHADYTSIAFKVGIPPDKNHLDGAHAPAPYNTSGLWWSWAGGYKYMRIDLTSAAQPIW
ncbi:MAG TPA: MbnP family copper-binding protein, partial [Polyangiaceae bacterium]|nr:MbnP family copper-binding protein [Polyangiaceae bacterium]